MARQDRSDKTVGKLEENAGLPNGAIRNKDGKNTRSDKTLGTIRKEQSKYKFQAPEPSHFHAAGWLPDSLLNPVKENKLKGGAI